MDKPTEKILLVKLDEVVGYLYIPKKTTHKAIIYADGGPMLGNTGEFPIWDLCKKYGYILFIPDYKGYCHSYGKFNFKGCVDTLIESEKFLKGNLSATDLEKNSTLNFKCKDLILIGASWGGAIVPFLEKYQKSSIKYIGLLKPVTDWKSQGRTKYKEENVDQTNQWIINGWANIYRSYKNSEWPKIFKGQLSEFNPLDNIHLLKDKIVFLCHGKKDHVVNWHKSERYHQKFKTTNPETKIYLKYFKNFDHGEKLDMKGTEYILRTIKNNLS